MNTDNENMTGVPDSGARTAALDPARSFIVQAPAGSGKTELLMQRFMSVLATATDPAELLAITFTRKAAGEMLERITGSLERSQRPSEPIRNPNDRLTRELAEKVMERDRELGWGLLENPSKLRVMTIDSFSASVAASAPLMSGSGSGQTVTDTPDELYAEAALRTVALAEAEGADGDAVRRVLAHLDNSVTALTDRIERMLGKRDQWLRHVTTGMNDAELRAVLEGSLAAFVTDELEHANSTIPEGLGDTIVGFGRFAAENLIAEGKESPITAFIDMDGLPAPVIDALSQWKGVAALLVTKGGDIRSPRGVNKAIGFPNDKGGAPERMKKAFQELLEGLADDTALAGALARVQTLPEPWYSDEEWEVLGALVRLLPVADALLREVFAERRQVDFQEVAAAAIRALGTDVDPTDLMLALDLRLQHILVDEYQDTSRTQLELLRLLTSGWVPGDGRTLFIVGDPMQSIYLFREADVGLFLDARTSGVGGVELEPLTLSSNFRSGPAIVDWVNESFAGAFPTEENRHTGAVTYAVSDAVRTEIERLDPEVRIWSHRDDGREARDIAEIVSTVPEDESIAVLVRSRVHLADIIAEFAARGIEYESIDIDPLAERPVIQGLLAITRAIYNPLDRISVLAVLRAPWCGLALADIHALCIGDASTPVAALSADWTRTAALTEDGRARLERTAAVMMNAATLRGRCAPEKLVESVWVALGGPACLKDESEMRDAVVFLDMLATVDVSGGAPSIDEIEERTEKLYAAPAPAAGRAVQVMTIHKAKGLEFDHVILPGVGRRPMSTERELLMWVERGTELILAPVEKTGGSEKSVVYNYVRGIYKDREELERTRLLYVAATRARKRLYMFAHVHSRDDGGHSITSSSLLKSIEHRVGAHIPVTGIDTGVETAAGSGVDATGQGARLTRLPSEWTAPGPAPALPVTPKQEPYAEYEGAPVFEWAGPGARHLGTVVHGCLAAIATEGVERWNSERVAGERERISAALRGLGIGTAEAERLSVTATEMITAVLGDERGRWVLTGGAEGGSDADTDVMVGAEIAITARGKDGAMRLVIDRTFIASDGTRWVVDYKTGTHSGGSLNTFLDSERSRYEPQLRRYAAALRAAGEVRPIRMGLYFPAFGGWVEWE